MKTKECLTLSILYKNSPIKEPYGRWGIRTQPGQVLVKSTVAGVVETGKGLQRQEVVKRYPEPCLYTVLYLGTECKKNDLYFLVPFWLFERKFPFCLGFSSITRWINSKQIKSWDRKIDISKRAHFVGLVAGGFPLLKTTLLDHADPSVCVAVVLGIRTTCVFVWQPWLVVVAFIHFSSQWDTAPLRKSYSLTQPDCWNYPQATYSTRYVYFTSQAAPKQPST